MSVSMLLALLAALCVPRAVLPHGWSIISCANSLRRESSATDVTPAYLFVNFCHNTRELLTIYTYQCGVSETKSEEIPVDRVYLLEFFLTTLASVCSSESIPLAK